MAACFDTKVLVTSLFGAKAAYSNDTPEPALRTLYLSTSHSSAHRCTSGSILRLENCLSSKSCVCISHVVEEEAFEQLAKSSDHLRGHPEGATSTLAQKDVFSLASPDVFNQLRHHPIALPGSLTCRAEVVKETALDSVVMATKVHIVAIASEPLTAASDSQLKEYFKNRRLLAEDCIFAVPIEDKGLLAEDITANCRLAYFKVKHVSPSSAKQLCWVDYKHSTLILDGEVERSYVPSHLELCLSPGHTGPWHRFVPPGLDEEFKQLQQIVLPAFSAREKLQWAPRCHVLVTGPHGCGKQATIVGLTQWLGVHLVEVSGFDLTAETSAAAEAKLKAVFRKARRCAPSVVLLRHAHAICKDRDGAVEEPRLVSAFRDCLDEIKSVSSSAPVVVVAVCSGSFSLTSSLEQLFLHRLEFCPPPEAIRLEMLQLLAEGIDTREDHLSMVAKRTTGAVLSDLCALIAHAIRSSHSRRKKTQEQQPLELSESDWKCAVQHIQAAQSSQLGAPKVPEVSWSDVGGLAKVRQEILDTVQLPLEHPELFHSGLKRSGVLLYGPPGCGKTLLAKAVATECSVNFMSVKGPELLNMYVGQSEENVRQVFSRARSATPCVVFFDELDALAPNRGRSGDSGGVMDRIVSQLLTELDGIQSSGDVFIIGATNRPDLIDPALLRPGRFDRLIYVGMYDDRQSQLEVLKALTRKFHLGHDVDLEKVLHHCPSRCSGADLSSLCSDAITNVLERHVAALEDGAEDESSDDVLVVTMGDFLMACQQLVPSVSQQDNEHYKFGNTTTNE